jgi:hypothetical protein
MKTMVQGTGVALRVIQITLETWSVVDVQMATHDGQPESSSRGPFTQSPSAVRGVWGVWFNHVT